MGLCPVVRQTEDTTQKRRIINLNIVREDVAPTRIEDCRFYTVPEFIFLTFYFSCQGQNAINDKIPFVVRLGSEELSHPSLKHSPVIVRETIEKYANRARVIKLRYFLSIPEV